MERGFSILEAIVALALIVTGVVALAGLAARATDTVVRARQRSVGVHLADAALTELAARVVPPTMPGCLLSDVAGCVEYRDGEGRSGRRARCGVRRAVVRGRGAGQPRVRPRFSPCARWLRPSVRQASGPPAPARRAC